MGPQVDILALPIAAGKVQRGVKVVAGRASIVVRARHVAGGLVGPVTSAGIGTLASSSNVC